MLYCHLVCIDAFQFRILMRTAKENRSNITCGCLFTVYPFKHCAQCDTMCGVITLQTLLFSSSLHIFLTLFLCLPWAHTRAPILNCPACCIQNSIQFNKNSCCIAMYYSSIITRVSTNVMHLTISIARYYGIPSQFCHSTEWQMKSKRSRSEIGAQK